ncbi:MAG: metal-dependent transcriptional regulator [Roseiflexaceae bacterium]
MEETHENSSARRRHGQPGPTEKMREYLEVIYYLAARGEPVISARLAEWMHVTPPTVTDIVRRMEERGYITRDSRGEISLTPEGFTLAEAMVKRHRILECFLVQVMGVPWHQIHEEAVRLEHALSPTMEARIEALVGHSATCPHGNPIPGNSALYPGTVRLDHTSAGQRFVIERIVEEAEEDSALMEFLQSNGLIPGRGFDVRAVSTNFGVTLHGDGQTITLQPQLAAQLWGKTE